MVLHTVLAVIFVGWQSGFHYYILSLTPLIYYSQIWRDSLKLGLTLVLAVIYIALFLFTLNQVPLHALQPFEAQVVGIVNICTLFVVFSALAALYRAAATHAEDGLTRANLKLEQLAPYRRMADAPVEPAKNGARDPRGGACTFSGMGSHFR